MNFLNLTNLIDKEGKPVKGLYFKSFDLGFGAPDYESKLSEATSILTDEGAVQYLIGNGLSGKWGTWNSSNEVPLYSTGGLRNYLMISVSPTGDIFSYEDADGEEHTLFGESRILMMFLRAYSGPPDIIFSGWYIAIE